MTKCKQYIYLCSVLLSVIILVQTLGQSLLMMHASSISSRHAQMRHRSQTRIKCFACHTRARTHTYTPKRRSLLVTEHSLPSLYSTSSLTGRHPQKRCASQSMFNIRGICAFPVYKLLNVLVRAGDSRRLPRSLAPKNLRAWQCSDGGGASSCLLA
jgi:hypothetical protein